MTAEHTDGSHYVIRPTIPRPEIPIPELSTLPEVYRTTTTLGNILGDQAPDDSQGYLSVPVTFSASEIPDGRGYVYSINPTMSLRNKDLLMLFDLRGKLRSTDGGGYYSDFEATQGVWADAAEAEKPVEALKSTIDHHGELGEYWDEYLNTENEVIEQAIKEPTEAQLDKVFDLAPKYLIRKDVAARNLHELVDLYDKNGRRKAEVALERGRFYFRELVQQKYGVDIVDVSALESFVKDLKERDELKVFLKDLPMYRKRLIVDYALPYDITVIDPVDVRNREYRSKGEFEAEVDFFEGGSELPYLTIQNGKIFVSYHNSWAEYRMTRDGFEEVRRHINTSKKPKGVNPVIRWANVDGERYYLSQPADPNGDEQYIAGMVLAAYTNEDFINGLPSHRGLKKEPKRQKMMEAQAPVHISLARKKLMQIPLFELAEKSTGLV